LATADSDSAGIAAAPARTARRVDVADMGSSPMSGVEHRTWSRADQSFLVICVRSRRTLPQGTVRCGKWRSGDFQHPAAAPRCHHSPLQDRSRGPRSHGCYRAGFDRLPRTGCSQLAGCSQDRRRPLFRPVAKGGKS
jgi:hypothetical protein